MRPGNDHPEPEDDDAGHEAVGRFLLHIGLFFIGGIVLLAIGAAQVRDTLAAQTWPVTQGVITDAFIEETTRYRKGIETTSYTVRVAYDYEVAGMRYSGDRISLGTIDKNESTAYRYLDRFPIGASVDVYYHPQIPSRAALDTRVTGGSKVMIIAGGVMLLLGVGGMIFVTACGRKETGHPIEQAISPVITPESLPLRRPI